MAQEEKELLLKDLCARLPYMPKIKITYHQQGIKGIDEGNVSCDFIERIVNDLRNGVITDMQIYLRPMSSMTEKEKKEFESIWDSGFGKALDAQISNFDDCVIRNLEINASSNAIDWLNKKMFAYRTIDGKDMFELGIALEAQEGMYDLKDK